MALTQQPNEYNLAYVPNVFTVDGIGATDKKYILTVLDENDNALAEFRQPANPAGVAHFDVSRVLQAQMEPAFVETTSFASETPKETFKYRVRYGVINADNDPTYEPNAQYSPFKYVINGYDDWRTLNWEDQAFQPEGTLLLCEGVGGGNSATYREVDFLTNYPKDAYPLRSSAYHTLSFFNRMENWNDGTQWDGTVIAPAFVQVKFYTSIGTLIQTSVYSINEQNGLGPRPDYNQNTLNAYTNDNLVGTIGVGPQNLKDAGIWPNGGFTPQIWGQITQSFGSNTNIWNLGPSAQGLVDHYTVEIISMDQCYWNDNGAPADNTASTLMNYFGNVMYSYRFDVADPCTNFNAITVSFINQYGVKDYFTFDRRNTRTVQFNRNNYNQSLGSWSDASFSIAQHRGGKRTFSTDIETELTLSSYWMSDEESKWLEELFASPSVQAYVDGKWEPCVIGSTTYEEKTYARDRMFQHTISLIYSNNKTVQRG